jgi:hypothetical protein
MYGSGLITILYQTAYSGGGGADQNFFLLLSGDFFELLNNTEFLLL